MDIDKVLLNNDDLNTLSSQWRELEHLRCMTGKGEYISWASLQHKAQCLKLLKVLEDERIIGRQDSDVAELKKLLGGE